MVAVNVSIGPGWEIGPGWTIGTVPPPPTLVLSLDAGNPASYPGSGTTWTDTVGGVPFTLNGGVTYNSANGGYLNFDPALNQYAQSASIAGLNTWTVETWHYYAGTNTGTSPCILTEVFVGGGINYTLGAINNDISGLCAGWFNGGQWIYTGTSYNLTPGAWYQIVGTYDGNFPKLYVNNTLVATGITSGGSAFASGYGIRLMRRWDDNDYWGGRLGIVKIYDGALDAGGVTAEWNANRSRFGL
jgi:Concanavalin A-like lectin/glucanases superfamily